MKRIVTVAALAAWHCLAWTQPSVVKTPPTQAEINQVIQSLLLCSLNGSDLDLPDKTLHNRVLKHLDQQENLARQHQSQAPQKFQVLNAEFQQFFMGAGRNEAMFVAWSPKAKLDTLLAQLRRMGHKAVGVEMKEVKRAGWQVERVSPDGRAILQLFPGRMEPRENAHQQGVSLMCTRGSVPDDVSLARTGIPSTQTIRNLVAGEAPQTVEWVDRIIASGHILPQLAISEYRWLQPEQVDKLLALKQPVVDASLAANAAVALSPSQLNTLLSRAEADTLRTLASFRLSQLSPAQQEVLGKHPDAAEVVVFKRGGLPALHLLETRVKADDLQKARSAFEQIQPMTPEAIDIVVTHGSPAMKTWMTMDKPLDFTPAQIDALLRDPVAAVQIGVLRRKEVQITRAQYDQSVNHSDENLAFWYRIREEFVPSAEQIEKGLNSSDETTRRGWVLGKHYHLTDSQVARVWQDEALRGSLMSRTDFVLSQEQADACTVDPNPSIRMACVQRADYELTHQRFENMLLDSNPNVLGDFLRRKEPRVNLAPFVEQAMQNGNNLALMAIARNNKVPVSEADVRHAQSHANAAVRVAFCKRQPQVCVNQNDNNQKQSLTELEVRNTISERSYRAFHDDDFAALQEQAMRMSQSEPQTPSGVWAMRYFYDGLESVVSQTFEGKTTEAGLGALKAKLNRWTAQHPEASAPIILQAMAYLDAATRARNNKDKEARSEEAYLNAAHFHLSRHKSLASVDPQWYLTMLLVAQRQYWPSDRMEKLVAEVHEKAPSFLPFHFSMVQYNSPKWCGSLEELDAYIKRAMISNEPREGKSYYARLYWYASEVEFGDKLLTDSLVQWPLMRQGFEDIVARYPVAWNINHFARFACMAGDKETTRKLLQKIKGDLIPWVWSSDVSIGYCERLARAS